MARKKAHKSHRRSSSKRKMPLRLLEKRLSELTHVVHARHGKLPSLIKRKAKHRSGR